MYVYRRISLAARAGTGGVGWQLLRDRGWRRAHMTKVLAAALPVLLALSSLSPSDLLLGGVPNTQGYPSTSLPEEARRHLAGGPTPQPPTGPQPSDGAGKTGPGAGGWGPSLIIDLGEGTAGGTPLQTQEQQQQRQQQQQPQSPPVSAEEAEPYTFGGGLPQPAAAAAAAPGGGQPRPQPAAAAAGAADEGPEAGRAGCPIGGTECPFANGHGHSQGQQHAATAAGAGGGVGSGHAGMLSGAAVSGSAVEGVVGAALLRAPHARMTVVPLPPLPSLTSPVSGAVPPMLPSGSALPKPPGTARRAYEAAQPTPPQPGPPEAATAAAAQAAQQPASVRSATAAAAAAAGGALGGLPAGPRPSPAAALGGWSISGLVEPVVQALRVHSAATAADLAAAARLRAAAEGAAARLRQHLDSVREQQRQLDSERDAAAAAGDYAAAARLRLQLDGLEVEAGSLEAAARLDSLTEVEGGVRAAQAAALLAAAAELRRLSAAATGALSRLQAEMAEVQALSRHSQQTDVRRELRLLALDAAAAESAAAAALAEHRAANRAVLTDAAGLVRNLTAADSLAAAAAGEAELLRGQLAVALQMQDYEHATELRSSLSRLEEAAAGGGGAAAAFGRLLAAHQAVVAQRLADFGAGLRRLQRAGVLVGLTDDLRRMYGSGQVDAAEALRLASGLAAAVRELEATSTSVPPAVERGQAEEIVRGLVM
ncbi:hypothetical protein HYH02_013910 [Chlamydomonas schloesseri]|uniref:Uncharacterized protein n=1 Tax=Chlamydomonas schloesseri TaxID=2026947 RepID=A0A835VY64_9CHLO|nr:hypothetical protein HYH02_013910 [Chlamydomonas schloesseri]|eukprot:KAG2429959.1 hypothetical protein HYH02_013910 [Chlamydomonas schloesseri]